MRSIREFGLMPGNAAGENRRRLQEAIDWAAERGAALYVEPSDEPYPLDGGLLLRMNASLVGMHGPVGRGTRHPRREQPVGSVFAIEDEAEAFITTEAATQLRGLQFWYPRQAIRDASRIIEYPATVQVARHAPAHGVTLSCLTFFGEFLAMDYNAGEQHACEQILFEHCYGYPLSGQFIRIDRCYDIPRILHCHVNPATQRFIRGDYSREVNDAVIARRTFAYAINRTDNAQLIDVFTFGTYGGVFLGPASYGQMTSFNLDCVAVGIHKQGDNPFNRNWQIAQGSIIANLGDELENIHPIIVEGHGHTAISNVEAFSGGNPAVTTVGQSHDFLLVEDRERLTISLYGCRMRNYVADDPITNRNPQAVIQALACIDREERAYNRVFEPAARQEGA
jgi:hypothetical protein